MLHYFLIGVYTYNNMMIRILCLSILAVVSFGEATSIQAGKPLYVSEQSAGLTDDEKANIVSRHNTHRGAVSPSASGMVPLQWNDELAGTAQSWADECTFAHDSGSDRATADWSWVGQNIAYGYGYSLSDYIDSWNNEKQDYDHNSNTCASGKVCGHYTQEVWAASTDIGCGLATCENEGQTYDYLVCNYGPGGNFNGGSPYTSGTACSNCPSGYAGSCDANLCTSG